VLSNQVDNDVETKLAPPGAGLPKVELFVARILFGLKRWRGDRESFAAQFQREREAIRVMVNGCDAARASKRVLIDRVRGLEDSSRFWSVWMTLEHLRIVHQGITGIIAALANGVRPPDTVSTAAVKPKPTVDGTVVAAYEQSCDDLVNTVAKLGNLRTTERHAHPWFGPLDAPGWHALAAGHLAIHRAQIGRILDRL
jgi:hypothetical protein